MEFLRADLMVAALAVLGLTLAFHVHTVRVLSPSMQPTVNAGDVAVVRNIAAADLEIGMILVARKTSGEIVMHRITDVRPGDSGALLVQTQGDANPLPDDWTSYVKKEDAVVMIGRIPLGWIGTHLPVLHF